MWDVTAAIRKFAATLLAEVESFPYSPEAEVGQSRRADSEA